MSGFAVQHPNAGGAIELMAGEDEKVGIQILNVDRDVPVSYTHLTLPTM